MRFILFWQPTEGRIRLTLYNATSAHEFTFCEPAARLAPLLKRRGKQVWQGMLISLSGQVDPRPYELKFDPTTRRLTVKTPAPVSSSAYFWAVGYASAPAYRIMLAHAQNTGLELAPSI
jgi:hypothetical protein